jgi:hypothetical protein
MEGSTVMHFEREHTVLSYDSGKSILVCRDRTGENRKLWAKKLNDIAFIKNVLEDERRYYVAGESGDEGGQFLALDKATGSTDWFIPGRSFLQVVYAASLYLIFIDGEGRYFLLRVDRETGNHLWHHRVDGDLANYRFTRTLVELTYASGRTEYVSADTGKPLPHAR